MKKNLILKIVGIIMLTVAVKGTIFVLTDREFDYDGILMPFVYTMLGIFILATLFMLWLGFIKKSKAER